MKLLYDFFPIIVFFIVYKLYGIYAATGAAIVISVVQVVVHRLRTKKFDRMQLVTLVMIAVLGGATLIFHNEIFIKWKPTVVNWVFAIAFGITQFITKKPLIQTMLEKEVKLPAEVWTRLNLMWIAFFILMGIANLLVAYNFDTNTWVNFKLFGMLGLTILFVILQSFYLVRYIKNE